MILAQRSKKVKNYFKKISKSEKCTWFYPSAFLFLNELVTTAATAVVVVEASAKEKDYDKDNNPRRTIATVIATATHSQTSFRFSKSYYEKQKEVLQFSKCNDYFLNYSFSNNNLKVFTNVRFEPFKYPLRGFIIKGLCLIIIMMTEFLVLENGVSNFNGL